MRILCAILSAVAMGVSSLAVETIRVAGSDQLGEPFTRALVEFARQNDVTLQLDLHGTRPGLEALKERRVDLGLFFVPPGEAPPADALVSKVIAYYVAVVVVPEASPLRQITVPQLRGIFALSAGEAFARWGELNLSGEWTSRPIVLQALSSKFSLTFPLFQRVILEGGAPKAGLERFATPAEFDARLATTVNAIGVTGMGASPVAGQRALAIALSPTMAAYLPTPENLHSGGYLLRLPLYVSFRRESAQALQPLLKFLLSDEGMASLAPAQFVGLPLSVRNDLIFEFEEIR